MVEILDALSNIEQAIRIWFRSTDFSFWLKKRSLDEFSPYIMYAVVGLIFLWVVVKFVNEWKKVREEKRAAQGKSVKKRFNKGENLTQVAPIKEEIDKELIKIGVLSLSPLAEERESEKPIEGMFVKEDNPDLVALTLATGYLFLKIDNQWYLFYQPRDLNVGHFLLIFFKSMWGQYKDGKDILKYGIYEKAYVETTSIPALSGKFCFECKEGQYREITAEKNKYQRLDAENEPIIRRLLFFRYLEEQAIADQGSELMLFEEIYDIMSKNASGRLWKVAPVSPELVFEIEELQKKDVKHRYPNGSRMKD